MVVFCYLLLELYLVDAAPLLQQLNPPLQGHNLALVVTFVSLVHLLMVLEPHQQFRALLFKFSDVALFRLD